MANKLLTGGLLGAGLWLAYRAWNTSESIKFFQYNIAGLKIKGGSLLRPQVIITISIYNPNQVGIPINQVFGTIKYQGMVIADFISKNEIKLAGREASTIDLACNINALSAIRALLGQKKEQRVTVDAMIKTGVFDMPITKVIPVNLGIGEMPDDSLQIGRARKRPNLLKAAGGMATLFFGRKRKKAVQKFLEARQKIHAGPVPVTGTAY